jgi:hypothetical protein
MLGKLFKYEVKATARIFLPLYFVLIVFAIINSFMSFNADDFSLPQFITLTLYIFILVGMFVASLIVMIQRFYKNLLSEEGYLMFTLPVKPYKHIISKLIVSVMWIILSSFSAIISILIIASREITLSEIFSVLNKAWNIAYSNHGASLYHFVIQMTVGLIVSMMTGILLIYVSISIGHLSNNHKILASIGAFIGIYTVVQIISGLIFIGSDGHGLIFSLAQQPAIPFALIWAAIGLSAVFAAIYFIITNTILNKRLNLE